MKKKIIFAIQNLRAYGGAQRVIVNLANMFSRDGCEAVMLTLDGGTNVYHLDEGIRTVCVTDGVAASRSVLGKLAKLRELRRIIKREKPDLIISFHIDISLFLLVSHIGLKAPVIVSERHDPTVSPRRRLQRFVRRMLYPGVDGFVFQTPEARDFFSRAIIKRSAVIANPVREDLPDNIPKVFEPYIVAAGRLSPEKRHDLTIRAFAEIAERFPEYSLRIYGKGLLHDELQSLIHSLGLDGRVTLCGTIPDLPDRMKNASLFVLGSNREGIPNVLLEALALGVPCVACDCPSGGPRMMIENGVNGSIVPVDNVEAMAAELARVLSDPELMRRYSENGAKCRQRFSLEAVYSQWRDYALTIMK